jgi:hypothetical protein
MKKQAVCVFPRGHKEGRDPQDWLSNRRRRTRHPVEFTLQTIEPYFELPQAQAARMMGVSLTTMKQICRRLDIERWPYRRPCHRQQSSKPDSEQLQLVSEGQTVQERFRTGTWFPRHGDSAMQAGRCRDEAAPSASGKRVGPSSESQSIADASRYSSGLVASALPQTETSTRFRIDAEEDAEALAWLAPPEPDVGTRASLLSSADCVSDAPSCAVTDSSRAPTPKRSAVYSARSCKFPGGSFTMSAAANGPGDPDEELSLSLPPLHQQMLQQTHDVDREAAYLPQNRYDSAEDYPLHVWSLLL